MINFFEKHFISFWFSVMALFAGTFLGHEISEMNLEKTYREIHQQRISESNRLQMCIKQIAGIR
jgi:hypothetical protein